MIGRVEGLIGLGLVAQWEHVGDVVGALVPDRRAAGERRFGSVRDGGQRLVVDCDELGRVLGLMEGLRDDERDGIAHIAHAVYAQRWPLRSKHRRAVRAFSRHGGFRAPEAIGSVVGARADGEHTRRGAGSLPCRCL